VSQTTIEKTTNIQHIPRIRGGNTTKLAISFFTHKVRSNSLRAFFFAPKTGMKSEEKD